MYGFEPLGELPRYGQQTVASEDLRHVAERGDDAMRRLIENERIRQRLELSQSTATRRTLLWQETKKEEMRGGRGRGKGAHRRVGPGYGHHRMPRLTHKCNRERAWIRDAR